MTRFLPLILLPVLAACAPASGPMTGSATAPATGPTDLPFFGDGYRAAGDPCRRVGENDYTNQFLDDAADLVGCPSDLLTLEVFEAQTGAIFVAQVGTTNLYTVPRR